MLGGSKLTKEGVSLDEYGCGLSIDVSRGVLANDTKGGFHPYHLLTLASNDPAWQREDFARWRRDFCYLGYVVALYLRAGSRAKQMKLTGSSSGGSDEAYLMRRNGRNCWFSIGCSVSQHIFAFPFGLRRFKGAKK